MAKKKAIIHRYDNLPDILAVEKMDAVKSTSGAEMTISIL